MLDLNQDVVFPPEPLSDDQPASAVDEDVFAPLLRSREAPAPSTEILKRGLNYSHSAMVDQLVANPAMTQNELAAHFGYSPSWISQVVNSDSFQAQLAARSAEFRDPILLASMEEQFKGILARGLELTREKLDKPEVSDNFLLRSMELSTRALGYGAKKDEGRNANVEEGLVDLSKNLVELLNKQRRASVTLNAEDVP